MHIQTFVFDYILYESVSPLISLDAIKKQRL